MPLYNINMYQDGVNQTDKMTSYTDEYIKEALANLGQRTGVKGDGLYRGEMSALELIKCSDYSGADDPKQYVKAVYSPNDGTVTSYLVQDITKPYEASSSTVTYLRENVITTKDIKVNDRTQEGVIYKKGGSIWYDASEYVTKFIVHEGAEDKIVLNSIHWTEDNKPHLSIGAHILTDGSAKTALVLRYAGSDRYTLEKYDISRIEASLEDILNNVIDDHDLRDSILTIVGTITPERYAVTYNSEASQFFVADPEMSDLQPELDRWGYELTIWFNRLRKAYNNTVYFDGAANALKRHILAEVIAESYKYYGLDNPDVDYSVYIPTQYKFNYFYNSNDAEVIYFSNNDINIYYTAIEDYSVFTQKIFNGENIVALGNTDKTINFGFTVDYFCDDTTDDYIVTAINAKKVYVLPYVNAADGFWYFNDVNSGIYAKGKDAGQPNIIICSTEYNGDAEGDARYIFRWISGVGKNLIEGAMKTTETANVSYKIPKASAEEAATTENLIAAFPKLSEITANTELLYLIENALIINLINIEQEQPGADSIKEFFGSGYASTIWRVDYDAVSNKYSYKYVVSPTSSEDGGYALTMNDIANIENYIKHSLEHDYEPDIYQHSWVVFDEITHGLKQQTSEGRTVQPVIMNKKFDKPNAEDPLEHFGPGGSDSDSKAQYNNPLNFIIEYAANAYTHTKVTEIRENDPDDRYFKISYTVEPNYTYTMEGDTEVREPDGTYSYTYVLDNIIYYTDHPKEFVPNAVNQEALVGEDTTASECIYPIVDAKEVLMRNINTLNRTNILGIAKSAKYDADPESNMRDFSGEIYYGYFGVSPEADGDDRKVLRIGTANTDINLGAATMTDVESTKRMNTFDELSIDLQTARFNGNVVFEHGTVSKKPVWEITPIIDGDTSYNAYTAIVHPAGTYGELLGYDAVKIRNTRYINEQCEVAPNAYSYLSYICLDKLFASMDLDYENAIIVADKNSYIDDYKLTVSALMDDAQILRYGDFTAYVMNPLQVTYIDGIKTTHEYISKDYKMVYSYTMREASVNEHWHCDGCAECAEDASHCPNRRLCKHTYFEIDEPELEYDSYNYTDDYESIMLDREYMYSYDAAVKLGYYSGPEEEYDDNAYWFSYKGIIWPEGEKGSGASYYDTIENPGSRDLFRRTITIKELFSTASMPHFQNKTI